MSAFTMKPVLSGILEAIGYDNRSGQMRVDLKDGTTYIFSGVPTQAYVEFTTAGSMHSHFFKHVLTEFTYSKSMRKSAKDKKEKDKKKGG